MVVRVVGTWEISREVSGEKASGSAREAGVIWLGRAAVRPAEEMESEGRSRAIRSGLARLR